MKEFEKWWKKNWLDRPHWLRRQCFDEGFKSGRQAALIPFARVVATGAVCVVGFASITMLTGCEDQYRYQCQDPDNFAKPDCQRPKCMFTQMCPDYLVAPILKDQINAQPAQAASEAASNR